MSMRGDAFHVRDLHHLKPESLKFLEALIKRRGHCGAARDLRVADTTVDRALGPGMQKATLERLEARIAEKQKGVANG